MDAWKNIRRCIYFVQISHCRNKNSTLPGQIRTKILSVRIHIRDQDKKSHAHCQSANILIIFLLTRTEQCKVNDCANQEKIPQHIWNNKIRAEWNPVICQGMDDMYPRFTFLYKRKGQHIKNSIQRNHP